MNGEIKIELEKEETERIKNKPLFIDNIENGDTLHIYFWEYGCNGTKSHIQIIKGENFSKIILKENMGGGIEKIFQKTKVFEYDINKIRAFEYDSYRKIKRSGCNDMGYSYKIKMNKETRSVVDSCGNWGGYYMLKSALFHD